MFHDHRHNQHHSRSHRSSELPNSVALPSSNLPDYMDDKTIYSISGSRSLDPAEEKRLYEEDYYSDYDPSVGARIALTLGVLILLFTLFVIYKSHCHVRKAKRLVASVQAQYNVQGNPQNTEQVH